MCSSSDAPIDLDAALDVMGGDRELLAIVTRSFLEDSPFRLEEIRTAIDQGDANKLRLSAHALKGSVRFYGDTPAYELAYRLETAGASGTLGDAADVFARLEQEIHKLRRFLADFVIEVNGDEEKDDVTG